MDKVKVDYGDRVVTKLLDEEGSKTVTNEKYMAGKLLTPLHVRYFIRHKVHDQKEEHTSYLAFSDEILKNKNKLDPEFRIEHTIASDAKGYYYTVHCYTQLEYV